jgi:hypothetical protein
MPKGAFNFGGGGVNSWGSICGGPNGGSAVLAQLGAPTSLKDEFLRWYETTSIPSNACYEDYAANSGTWVPPGGWVGAVIPLNNSPKSTALSILCHASSTKWRIAAKGTAFQGQDSDRCGKLVYDCVFKLATMINEWKAGTFVQTYFPDASTTASSCMNASCHNSASGAGAYTRGKTQCTESCHQ